MKELITAEELQSVPLVQYFQEKGMDVDQGVTEMLDTLAILAIIGSKENLGNNSIETIKILFSTLLVGAIDSKLKELKNEIL